MLKQDYKEGEMTLKSALALAVKVLNKTMDVSKLSAEKGSSGPLRRFRRGGIEWLCARPVACGPDLWVRWPHARFLDGAARPGKGSGVTGQQP